MKKMINYFARFVLLLFVSVFIGTGIFIATKKNYTPTCAGVSYRYIVKDYNGKVAIFSNKNDDKPDIVLDIKTNSLAKIDSDEIRTGIKVSDNNELKGVIENIVNKKPQ